MTNFYIGHDTYQVLITVHLPEAGKMQRWCPRASDAFNVKNKILQQPQSYEANFPEITTHSFLVFLRKYINRKMLQLKQQVIIDIAYVTSCIATNGNGKVSFP